MKKRAFKAEKFNNTEYEGMTENEIVKASEKYVLATIAKRFPDNSKFLSQHGLDRSDIVQFGLIGLMEAVRTYDPEKSNFETHAINHIQWSITVNSAKYSLYNVSKRTFELADIDSLNQKMSDSDEDLELINFIPAKTTEEDEMKYKHIIGELEEKLPERAYKIIQYRIQGYTLEEIGELLGSSKQAIGQSLRNYKKRIRDIIKTASY